MLLSLNLRLTKLPVNTEGPEVIKAKKGALPLLCLFLILREFFSWTDIQTTQDLLGLTARREREVTHRTKKSEGRKRNNREGPRKFPVRSAGTILLSLWHQSVAAPLEVPWRGKPREAGQALHEFLTQELRQPQKMWVLRSSHNKGCDATEHLLWGCCTLNKT